MPFKPTASKSSSDTPLSVNNRTAFSYESPPPSNQGSDISRASNNRGFSYVSPSTDYLVAPGAAHNRGPSGSGSDAVRAPVRAAKNIAQSLQTLGKDELAKNLLSKLDEVGYDEINFDDLTPFALETTSDVGPRARSEQGSVSVTSGSKTPWTKNSTEESKNQALVDPREVWPAVNAINDCTDNCKKSFVVSRVQQTELSFNVLIARRLDFAKKDRKEKKEIICAILEAYDPPFSFSDNNVTAKLCLNCLSEYFGKPLSTLNDWRRSARTGAVFSAEGSGRRRELDNRGEKSWAISCFITWFINQFGTPQKNLMIDAPESSAYHAGGDVWLIDKYSGAQLREEFDHWKVLMAMEELSVSDTLIKSLWDTRLKSSDPFPVEVRLDTGRSAGCDSCSRLYLLYVNAPRAEKALRMEQRMAHRTYVANQRAFHQTRVCADLDNANVEDVVQDGFDTWKAGVPLYGKSSPGHGEVLPLTTKVSGVISFGKLCCLFLTPPWVATGGNLSVTCFMAAMAARRQSLPAGVDMPLTLKVAMDGGPENWCGTWYAFGAWLVGVSMFKEVYIQRFPAHHGYNGMDATFAPMSTYFFGNKKNKISGKNIETVDQYVQGMRAAYTNRKEGGVLGGKPKISQLGFTYDFAAFIEPFMDKEFGGWGHSVMEWLDTDGARISGKRGSAIHFLHFFLDEEGTVRLRYKNAPTYPDDAWEPRGPNGETPDGRRPIGVTPFSVPTAQLPRDIPPRAPFKSWDDDDEVKTSILGTRRKHGAEFMSEASHEWWIRYFDAIPRVPGAVPAEQHPVWGYFDREGGHRSEASGSGVRARQGGEGNTVRNMYNIILLFVVTLLFIVLT